MSAGLEKYLRAFLRLRRGVTPYGLAPHKPVLLISLIELIDKGSVSNNQFEVSAELVATFKENWQLLVPTSHQPDFTLPFYHLQSEKVDGKPIWKLQPTVGMEINAYISSVFRLQEVCAFGHFEPELFILLTKEANLSIITDLILDKYFESLKSAFNESKQKGEGYLHQQEDFILNEPEARYRTFVTNTDEDVFVRNGLFKKNVLQVYGHQCSFTGMQLMSTYSHSFVDACHIVPFSMTHDDRVTNGIALCPNLHRAFDRGLVAISSDYTIMISRHIIEKENHAYSLTRLEGRRIVLPSNQNHVPRPASVEWHRENIFKQ